MSLPPSTTLIKKRRELHPINPLRLFFFGRPIATAHQEHARLPKILALPIFSSDAISSVAYASQEILLMLGMAGLWTLANQALYTKLTLGITIGIVTLLIIVVTSYWQTIFAYPSGGGSYIVSKENLGVGPGLIAGAALLIDYVLTVAVSIASGIQNMVSTPFLRQYGMDRYVVLLCVLSIAVIAFANLRGVKEAGTLFAIPTYLFVSMGVLTIMLGMVGPSLGWTLKTAEIEAEYRNAALYLPAHAHTAVSLSGIALLGLILRAFANGCAAMTGTEAISNSVPGFRKPESWNAALTLGLMAVILGSLFLGISMLATKLHVVYLHYGTGGSPAVIDQISGAVFGKTGPDWRVALYYTMQIATMLILVLAANTSFAGFPRLAAILARDRFMPRQLANQGDKLVFSNGIVLLAIFAIALIAFFQGSVDRLIPLYAVGVFTAFTLSQSGMVVHWWKLRGKGWVVKMVINGFGALCTGIVALIIIGEKWTEGAWLVIIVGAVQIGVFAAISRHYDYLRRRLSILNWKPDDTPTINTVILLVPSLHRGIFPALKYARSISPDCRAIHIETDPNETPRLQREWEQYVGEDIPLVILPSPYRSLIAPLLAYIEEAQRERENHMVTVVLPEFVPGRWWHGILHNANGLLIKLYLAQRPGVVVANVRYFLADAQESALAPAVKSETVTRQP